MLPTQCALPGITPRFSPILPPSPAAYRLLPMGRHPRVADRRGTYDLFGPVSKLWAQSYDRAMAIYLACLREFGEFARARCAACAHKSLD